MDIFSFLHQLSGLTQFALVMAFFLLLPRLAERLRLPSIVGFILTGVILGPQVFHVIKLDSPVILWFSGIGKLLLMFFAGYEINLIQFQENRHRSLLFGLLTFFLPFLTGFIIAFCFNYSINASILIGSLLASHTLLGFPIVKRLGLVNHEPVLITIGATIFTDILAIVILAMCLSVHKDGFAFSTLTIQLVELALYVPVIIFGLSWLARKLLGHYGNTKDARVTILFLVIAIAAELAELIHLEGIIGAFLTGIAVKRAVKTGHIEPNLDVMGQTFFIPCFFLTTGFLIDFKMFGQTITQHPLLVLGIVGGLISAKYLAAWLTAHLFAYSRTDRNLMWTLTMPQVAATLAAAVVAFKTYNAEGQPLIDSPILNTILVLVIITAVGGTILTGYYANQLSKDKLT